MGIFFGYMLIFQICFWACLMFPIFFGLTVDAGSKPTYEENMRLTPLGLYIVRPWKVPSLLWEHMSACTLSWVHAHLTHRAPPTICSRRQF